MTQWTYSISQLKLRKIADKKHPSNKQLADALYTKLISQDCKVAISLLCHSMGNYVLKNTLKTSDNGTSNLVFDNICLVAADANNVHHSDWVEQLHVRNRVYVVINENDFALKASRIKPGKEQKARLGHYTRNLDSRNAYYLDVTDAKGIGSEHTYFKGEATTNMHLRVMFTEMFKGRIRARC